MQDEAVHDAKDPQEAVAAEVTAPQVHETTEHLQLRCDLTAEEELRHSKALARAIGERDRVEDEAKAAKSEWKSALDEANLEMRKISNIIRSGYEMRFVPVVTTLDFTEGRVVVRRQDTFEAIEDREMRPLERENQGELFPPDEPEAEVEAVDDSDEEVDEGGEEAAVNAANAEDAAAEDAQAAEAEAQSRERFEE